MSTPWEKLATPFPFDDIQIKPQSVSKDKDSALAVAYVKAPAAQQRMDEAFGPDNWSFEVREHMGQKPGIIGRITVLVEGKTVIREDISEQTDVEPLKGAVSGAFKRCFSALGHRALHKTNFGWQPCTKFNGKFDKWTDVALNRMESLYCQQVGIQGPTKAPQKVVDANAEMMPQTPPQGQRTPTPNGQANGEAQPQGSNNPTSGKTAFGYHPEQWPPVSAFTCPRTDKQGPKAHATANDRGIPDDLYHDVRKLVLEAYGKPALGECTKGQMMLWIDWLINVHPDAVAEVLQTLTGQEALT